jgi:hypothetical protein
LGTPNSEKLLAVVELLGSVPESWPQDDCVSETWSYPTARSSEIA